MKDDLTLDLGTEEWYKAAELYERATGKDTVEIVNRGMRNIILRAALNTPIATSLRNSKITGNIINAARVKKGLRPLSKEYLAKAVEKVERQHRKSFGYIRSAWLVPFRLFGGKNLRGARLYQGKMASRSKGSLATLGNVEAEAENWGIGAEKVGLEPLQDAVSFVSRDMVNYADKILRKTADQYSGK